MRHFRMTCLFALASAALVSAMSSCSRHSDPAVMEPQPERQAGLPPVDEEPDDGTVPAEVDPKKWVQIKIDTHRAAQGAEPAIGKQGEQKYAVDPAVPKVAQAQRKGVKPAVPMVQPAAAAIPPAVDFSLVHEAPTDVAVLVIRPAQILANPKLIELSKHLKAMGMEYNPTRALEQSGQVACSPNHDPCGMRV